MHKIDDGIKAVNSLLRGELAATETYQQALGTVDKGPGAKQLRRILKGHREAVQYLRKEVRRRGGKPDRDSGAWGTWAKLVEGAAKLLGETAALKALKEGEAHGLKSYESALEEDALSDDSKQLIRSTLLPNTREHIATLDGLMNAKE